MQLPHKKLQALSIASQSMALRKTNPTEVMLLF